MFNVLIIGTGGHSKVVSDEIGRLKKSFRNKSKPIVIITGCVAQAEGDILLKKEKYIDAVIGPQSYQNINDTILKLEKKSIPINFTEFDVVEKFDSLNSFKNSDFSFPALGINPKN